MKRKLLAFVLAALMILSVVPLASFAAAPTELSAYLAGNVDLTKQYNVTITSNVSVSRTTVIPSNVTVNVMAGGYITLYADLIVYGQLNCSAHSIINNTGSSVIFNTISNWHCYNPNYPCTWYPMSGAACIKCGGKYSVHWCMTCKNYHCSACEEHIYVTPVYRCRVNSNHGELTFCALCREYYCQACVGGTHGVKGPNSPCIIVKFTYREDCAKHGNVTRFHCQYCDIHYCYQCEGGVHVYNYRTGKCSIYSGICNNSCTTHNGSSLYCTICKKNYYPCCEGYHVPSADGTTCVRKPASEIYYCTSHKTAKTYCADCKRHYCVYCSGGVHVYDYVRKQCYINNGIYTPPYGSAHPYYDYDYTYVPGRGYVISGVSAVAPQASIPTGTNLNKGAYVYLASVTPGAVIHYTLDGSTPTEKSPVYRGPILISASTTVKAVAYHPYVGASDVSVFTYLVKGTSLNPVFTDVAAYPGLDKKLEKLVSGGIINSVGKFDPTGTVSWKDLKDYLTALGLDITLVNIDEEFFANAEEITYEEFIYASYRILFANKLTVMSRTPAAIYNRFTYRSDFTQDVLYKSAYVNLYSDKMIYGTDFKPNDSVNRVYLATLLARIYDKLN